MPAPVVVAPVIPTALVAPLKAMRHVVVLAAFAIAGVALAILVGFDGWDYYRARLVERPFLPAHRLLRPSAPVGHLLGIGGLVMMLVPVAYAIRKKVPRLRNFGGMQTWLDVHIFSGIVGPVLVTFHTSFKFNGVVSVAYWSMVAVVLSGFVGRYLYVRIPRSLRGQELSKAELDARAAELWRRIAEARISRSTLAEIEALERRVHPPESASYLSLFFGEWKMLRTLAAFRARAASRPQLYGDAVTLISERATLLRRIAYLKKTKVLFEAWHVFHMPLVYVMFGIVIMHVAATLYMGYVPLMD